MAPGLAALALLGGCAGTNAAVVLPEQLPALAARPFIEYEIDEKEPRRATGAIKAIRVHHSGLGDVFEFRPPFQATLDGSAALTLAGEGNKRIYPIRDIDSIEVDYVVPHGTSAAGIALTVIGGLVLAGGIGAVSVAASLKTEAEKPAAIPLVLGGMIGIGVGSPPFIAGIVLLILPSPPKVKANLGHAAPRIELLPCSPRLSF
jgi:hypothetical protein